MAEYLIQDSTLTNICNALRTKTGTIGNINTTDIANMILNMGGNVDIVDLNSSCKFKAKIGSSYQEYNWNEVKAGTISWFLDPPSTLTDTYDVIDITDMQIILPELGNNSSGYYLTTTESPFIYLSGGDSSQSPEKQEATMKNYLHEGKYAFEVDGNIIRASNDLYYINYAGSSVTISLRTDIDLKFYKFGDLFIKV